MPSLPELSEEDLDLLTELSSAVRKTAPDRLLSQFSPFMQKELIMQSTELRKLMLIDYTCIPRVVATLCGESYNFADLRGGQNSALFQNYTDFWSLHNYVSYTPYSQFWDFMYKNLTETCCVELIKP